MRYKIEDHLNNDLEANQIHLFLLKTQLFLDKELKIFLDDLFD